MIYQPLVILRPLVMNTQSVLHNSEIRCPLVTCGAADLLCDAWLLRGDPSETLAQRDLCSASFPDVRKLS